MLRTMKARMALVLAVALAPAEFSTQGLIEKNAMANATYRPGMMSPERSPHSTVGLFYQIPESHSISIGSATSG